MHRIFHACLAVAVAVAASITQASAGERLSWPSELARASGRHDTIGNRVLAFEAALGENSNAVESLDNLLEAAVAEIGNQGNRADERIQLIGILKSIDALLTRRGFVFPPCGLVETLTASLTPRTPSFSERDRIIRKNARRGRAIGLHRRLYYADCDMIALLYLSITEVIGVDLAYVDLPTHSFLRHYFSNGSYVNWDPNDAEIVTDDEYATSFGTSQDALTRKGFLAPLSRPQLCGYLLMVRGAQFLIRGSIERAVSDFERSVELYAGAYRAHNALAWLYLSTVALRTHNNIEKALALASEAVLADPINPDYLDTLAWACAFQGRFEVAEQLELVASELEPDEAAACEYAAHVCSFAAHELPPVPSARTAPTPAEDAACN